MALIEDQKVWMIGLCVACPHLQEFVACPLNEIRNKPLKERVDIISDMTESQLESFITYHVECEKVRAQV